MPPNQMAGDKGGRHLFRCGALLTNGALSRAEKQRDPCRLLLLIVLMPLFCCGCSPKDTNGSNSHGAQTLVVYCSVDIAFATPILREYERRAGLSVQAIFDTEAGKTTGLVNKLLAERDHPRADVWWSSEIFGTMQLAQEGLFEPYKPTTAKDIPSQYRDQSGLWTAFGLRGRVLAYDPERISPEALPQRWCDLVDPQYQGRFAMADARFGTTRGHMATMLSIWGRPAMERFYEQLRENRYRKSDGNSFSVMLVTAGRVDFAATDTDDVIVAKARGDSIDMIYPSLDAPGEGMQVPGTLWIPCSVAMVKGTARRDAAAKLIDHLVSPELERKLYSTDSRNVPVRAALRAELGAELPGEAKVDYARAAAVLVESDKLVTDVLLK